MQKQAAYLMVAVLLLGLFLVRESLSGEGARIEQVYGDWIATNSSRAMPPAPAALVGIDDSSLSSEHGWPWSPLEYALFLRAALPFKPEVVAIAPALDWPRSMPGASRQQMEEYRAALHDCILQTPRLVLGSELGPVEDSENVPPLQPVPLLRNVAGDTGNIPAFADIAAQADEDYRLSASVGFTNFPADQGIVRKAPLLFKYRDNEIVPSFILQTLIQWYKLTPDDVKVDVGSRIELGSAAAIPIDGKGMMNVDYSAGFTEFSEDDLLLAMSEQQQGGKNAPPISTDALKGGIVLLARTDADSRTLLTPARSRISYGELCATALATVLNKAYSRHAGPIFDFAVIAVMMAASCFFHHLRRRAFALVSFIALLCYLMLSLSVYAVALVRLPILVPLGLLLLMNFFSLFFPRDVPAPAAPPQPSA